MEIFNDGFSDKGKDKFYNLLNNLRFLENKTFVTKENIFVYLDVDFGVVFYNKRCFVLTTCYNSLREGKLMLTFPENGLEEFVRVLSNAKGEYERFCNDPSKYRINMNNF